MGTTRHFHVVFDVRVLDLNLSNISCKLGIRASLFFYKETARYEAGRISNRRNYFRDISSKKPYSGDRS